MANPRYLLESTNPNDFTYPNDVTCCICGYTCSNGSYNIDNKINFCVCVACKNERRIINEDPSNPLSQAEYNMMCTQQAAKIHDRLGLYVCSKGCLEIYNMAPVIRENG
jgi:hypothetical protein